jgi:hypothetical protein
LIWFKHKFGLTIYISQQDNTPKKWNTMVFGVGGAVLWVMYWAA